MPSALWHGWNRPNGSHRVCAQGGSFPTYLRLVCFGETRFSCCRFAVFSHLELYQCVDLPLLIVHNYGANVMSPRASNFQMPESQPGDSDFPRPGDLATQLSRRIYLAGRAVKIPGDKCTRRHTRAGSESGVLPSSVHPNLRSPGEK